MITFLFDLLVATEFLVMLCVLVAAHEYGHYLFARLFGMGVEEFAIGMGKKVKVWKEKTYDIPLPEGYDPVLTEVSKGSVFEGGDIPTESVILDTPAGRVLRNKTEFTVRMLPVGGFVRIVGMIPQDDGSEVRTPGGFYSKPPWQRLVVLVGGPLFSVLAGLVVLIAIYMTAGIDVPDRQPIIGGVGVKADEIHVAHDADLRAGDRIVSVNGESIPTFFRFTQVVSDNPGNRLNVIFKRGDELRAAVVVPQLDQDAAVLDENLEPEFDKKAHGRIGVGNAAKHVVFGFTGALAEAAKLPVMAVKSMVGILEKPSRAKDQAGGAISMVRMTAEVTKEGPVSLLRWAGILSILVGIFNLLPIPPLDGGQMMMAFAELLRGGRRLSMRVQTALINAGVAAVFILFASVLVIDYQRWFGPKPEKTGVTQPVQPKK